MELQLRDGTTIIIIDNGETASVGKGRLHGVDAPGAEKVVHTVSDALQPIVQLAKETFESLKEIRPNELEISLGAEAGGEGGVFGLAKAHGKATIQIKLKWA